MAELSTGTVTFFFSDIEGSTRLLEALGRDYDAVLERHRQIVRDGLAAHGGTEIGTEGDSFFAVFPNAADGVAAAVTIQQAIGAEEWPAAHELKVRIGLHTGEGRVSGGDYVGLDVHRAARIMAAAHGGQVLVSDAVRTLAERSLGEEVQLLDLGDHRLRDLSGRERLYQVLAPGLGSDFPPLRTLDTIPNNLPPQLTSFLGREREIGQVIRHLERSRLLTLTGPGGTGKTRLALQVAARLLDRFHDGVFFVPLAPISEPSLVPATIAQHLGLPERGGADPMQALLVHLASRETLLVVDNFEQVQAASTVIGELLAGAPRLKVLVTSRSALHLHGEQEYLVPPLGLPDPRQLPGSASSLTQYESVALFIERASAVKPDFTLTNDNAAAVAEICVRLDGLPLAIELAAARIRILTPQAILERLGRSLDLLAGGARDLPDRQRTLRGAIGWSYEMLDEPDRSLFACLSVFVGGAGLPAIEAVCGELIDGDLLGPLESLTEKSLVRQAESADGEPRFWMLETIREYAIERSEQSGRQADLQRRHAEWFTRLAETAQPMLMSAERRSWLDRVEQDHDNIRAALAWATGSAQVELALRLVGALWRFWQMRGYLREGQERTEKVLEMDGVGAHPQLEYGARDALGGLAYWRGRHPEARRAYQRALELARQLGDRRAEAEQLYNISFSYSIPLDAEREPGDLERARDLVEEALRIYTEIDDKPGRGKTAWQLSNLELITDRFDRARTHAETALATFTELNDRFMLAWTHWGLASVDYRQGRLGKSDEHLRAALALFEEAQDVSAHVLILTAFAALAERVGDRQRAARLSGAAATLAETTGTGIARRIGENLRYDPEPLRLDPDTAAAWADGEGMTVEEARACARETVVPAELASVPT
jgi:predicted ATPase/class 3 adenylate cyclase